jgi:multisubunit Na+/H+ antiporter MnhB subunit
MDEGMSLIVKTVTRLVASFIVLFGIYIVLHGHISPGGGFAGGAILAAAMILLLLAFGRERTQSILWHRGAVAWDCGGAIAFLAIAVLGFVAGSFFVNFLVAGETYTIPGVPYTLASAGTIPLCNAAIGAKVGGGLFGVFIALATFRPGRRHDPYRPDATEASS